MPKYYPVSLNLKGRRCLVVGGGEVALRKAKTLLDADAKVAAVAPRFATGFARLKGVLEIQRRRYRSGDLRGCFFVVAATDDGAVNARVSRDARARRILVNVVDAPDLSDAIIPSTLRRGDFTVSVSTGGNSPRIAADARRALEKMFPKSWGGYVSLVGELRRRALKCKMSSARRKKIMDALVDRRGFVLYAARGRDAARAFLEKKISGR